MLSRTRGEVKCAGEGLEEIGYKGVQEHVPCVCRCGKAEFNARDGPLAPSSAVSGLDDERDASRYIKAVFASLKLSDFG